MGLLITMIVLTILTAVSIVITHFSYVTYRKSNIINGIKNKYSQYSTRITPEMEDAINEKINEVKVKSKIILFTPLSFIWMLFCIFGCFTTIGAGQVGIVFNSLNGGIQEETLTEGFQTKSIFSSITKISTANRNISVETTGQTKDSIYATFDITVVYKIESSNAGNFYKVTLQNDISESQMNSIIKEVLQAATIKEDIYTILGSSSEEDGGSLETVRADFASNLEDSLLERYYITLVSVSFDDIDAGERIEEVIKAKAEALQQIEIETANATAAEIAAEASANVKMIELKNQLAMAEASANNEALIAEIQKEIATVEAEIIQIQADADAYKVEVEKIALAKSIEALYYSGNGYTYDTTDLIWVAPDVSYTPSDNPITWQEAYDMIIASMFYDTWDGELPMYVTNGDLALLLPGATTDTEN